MSLRAYAKRRNVSAMSVSTAVKVGRLKASVTHDRHGQPKIADPELADREWDANTDPQKRANAAGGAVVPEVRRVAAVVDEDIATSTERLKAAQADLAELKYREAAGELVPAVDVTREWAQLLSQVRTKLLGIPTRLKQAIPTLSVADVVLVEDLVRESLEDLAAGQ